MAQENALIVLDDQREVGKTFGRVRNRRELTTDWTGELPKVVEFATIVPLPTDVERICEVNHLRRRVQIAEARERKQRRRAQETEARCSMRLTNIAGVCIFGAMVLAALVCLGAGVGWLASIPAAVAVSVSKIAGWW